MDRIGNRAAGFIPAAKQAEAGSAPQSANAGTPAALPRTLPDTRLDHVSGQSRALAQAALASMAAPWPSEAAKVPAADANAPLHCSPQVENLASAVMSGHKSGASMPRTQAEFGMTMLDTLAGCFSALSAIAAGTA